MLKSKLDLINSEIDDVQREFQNLVLRIRASKHKEFTPEEIENWNDSMNGWINFFESLKK